MRPGRLKPSLARIAFSGEPEGKRWPSWAFEMGSSRITARRSRSTFGIDMETATIFVVGHANQISRGALLLVSDVPITPDGVKTEQSDLAVTRKWATDHLEIGIKAMMDIGEQGERIIHFRY